MCPFKMAPCPFENLGRTLGSQYKVYCHGLTRILPCIRDFDILGSIVLPIGHRIMPSLHPFLPHLPSLTPSHCSQPYYVASRGQTIANSVIMLRDEWPHCVSQLTLKQMPQPHNADGNFAVKILTCSTCITENGSTGGNGSVNSKCISVWTKIVYHSTIDTFLTPGATSDVTH